MAHTVNCVRLQREAEGLDAPPYPGDLGRRIFDNVSKEAWQLWLQHQTMLINEKRLAVFKPEVRKYLEEQMERFFFGGDVEQPAGYVSKQDNGGNLPP